MLEIRNIACKNMLTKATSIIWEQVLEVSLLIMKCEEKWSFVKSTKNIFAVAVRFQSQGSSILNQDFLKREFYVLLSLGDHHTVVFIMKLVSAYYLRQFRLWPRKLDKSPSPQTSNPSTKLRPWAMQYCNIQFVRGPFSDSLITNCSKFTANQPANGFDGEKCEKSNMSEAESCQNLNLVGKHVKPRVSKVCALRKISINISCFFWKRNRVGRKHAIKIDNTDES